MSLQIIDQDIITLEVDAIVNAANEELLMGGGICGAIFNTAGPSEMKNALKDHGPIRTGEAVATPGFNLAAKHVIHAVGPRYQDGKSQEEDLLSSAYKNSLDLAVELGCESIAFPLISSGIFGYPKEQVVEVAVKTIKGFLQDHEIMVYLSVIKNEKIFRLAQKLAE